MKMFSITCKIVPYFILLFQLILTNRLESPIFSVVPDSIVEIDAGSNITLKCEATGFPYPQIKWIRKDSENNDVNGNELIIINAKPNNEGVYECVAKNKLGIAAKTVKLKVIGGDFQINDEFLRNSDNINLMETVEEAKSIVDQAINRTLNIMRDTTKRKLSAGKLLQIARFPQLPESIEFAKSIEIYEKSLELIKRKTEARIKLPSIDFKYEDLLSPNQLNILAHLSGCLVGNRLHNSLFVANCDDICFHKTYRTYDGVCNNLINQLWGSSMTPFQRLLPPIYEDGINLPVGWFEDRRYAGYPKPNARTVCREMLTTNTITADSKHSHMVMQFGQFLDHDIDFSLPSVSFNTFDRQSLDCSKTCEKIPPCFSIPIPDFDPRHNYTTKQNSGSRRKCIELVRSSASCGSGLTSIALGNLMHREQVNQLTSFIDGSNIYGSTYTLANHLREKVPHDNGLLRFSRIDGKIYLPFNSARLPNDCQQDPRKSYFGCFLAGDVRANEQLGLLSMHTLWLREHNRIATQLKSLNPLWDGDRVYHESRKIVGAQLQIITYRNWLPHIFGKKGMKLLGRYNGYDINTNPSIFNAFATAALRFGHTLINPFLLRLNESYEPTVNISSHLSLHNAFFAPHRLVEEGGIDPLLRGLLFGATKTPKSDQIINEQLTENLFVLARDVALDLGSINIQRGRDHGLPSYNQWRKYCNISIAHTFDDLKKEIKNEKIRMKLKNLYGHPDNIDLWVGAVAEDVVEDVKVGPTFLCLLIAQFKRLRDGDRFYFENRGIFNKKQSMELRKTSLSRVLCDNGDNITKITEDVFIIPEHQQWKRCEELPFINLKKWKSDSPIGNCKRVNNDDSSDISLHLLTQSKQ